MIVTEILVRGTLVAAAALGTHGAMRGRSPALRHLVLVVGLGILAALPAEVAFGPRWRPAIGAMPAHPPSTELIRGMASIAEAPPRARARAVPSHEGPAIHSPTAGRAMVAPLITFVAALGALLCLALRVVGGERVRRVVARGIPLHPTDHVMHAARQAAASLRLRRSFRVIVSDEVTVPFTTGLVRPCVVVPPGFASWSASAARAVLLHELAHIRRRDVLARLVAEIACALNWFNPLVWLCARQSLAEAEYACDDAVVRSRVSPSVYARQLVRLARSLRRRRLLEPVVGLARTALASRVERLMDSDTSRGEASRPRSLIAAAAVGALGLAFAAATPRLAVPQFAGTPASTLNISSGGPEISSNAAGLQARWVVNGRHTGMFITGVVDLDDVLAGRSPADGGSFVIAQESDDGLLTYASPNAGPAPVWVRESLRLASRQLRDLPSHGEGQPTPAAAPRAPRLPGAMLVGTPARSDDPTARVLQAGWVENRRRFGVFMRGRWSTSGGRPRSSDAVAWLDAFVWDAGKLTRLTITRSSRADVETRLVRDNQPSVADVAAFAWAARIVDHVNAAGVP